MCPFGKREHWPMENLIFADGKDEVNFELLSQSCNVFEIVIAVFCGCLVIAIDLIWL